MPEPVFGPDKALGYTVCFIYVCEHCKGCPAANEYCKGSGRG